MIQERVFARVFTALHSDADAGCFDHSDSQRARGAALRSFAAKTLQTVENDREMIRHCKVPCL
jgi:hypothetical protein